MTPDQYRDAARDESRRQTRRTLFIVFVVIPVGCILAIAARVLLF